MTILKGKNLKRMFYFLVLLAGAVACCDEPALPGAEETSAIQIRSAPIEGKIFLLTEERGSEEVPGANVYVKIRLPGEREIFYQTKTLKDGSYQLPQLDPQDYQMLVGDLRLELKVFPETSQRTNLAKVLIIMIPREMAGPGAGAGK